MNDTTVPITAPEATDGARVAPDGPCPCHGAYYCTAYAEAAR